MLSFGIYWLILLLTISEHMRSELVARHTELNFEHEPELGWRLFTGRLSAWAWMIWYFIMKEIISEIRN